MNDSLTLKYRPKTFETVIGQDAIVRSFQKVLRERINHTFLLSGPSGTGKTTLARIAAVEVGCEPKDIQEVDAATFTGIDDMRALTASLAYRPLGNGRAKAFVIDECHAISKQAWQSLLKSLEEPPEWVFWFLCTTDPTKVPANIQTRCTKYDLKPVAAAPLGEWLVGIARAEKLKVPEAVLDLCAREAQGSPRAALVNLGACLEAKGKEEAQALLKSAEGSVEAVELARALAQGAEWFRIKELLEGLAEQNPESVRHVVRAYVTKVIMGAKKPNEMHFAVLEAFGTPFPSGDGISPLVLACGKLLFGE